MLSGVELTAAIHNAACRVRYSCSAEGRHNLKKHAQEGNLFAEAYLVLTASGILQSATFKNEVIPVLITEESKGCPYAQFMLGALHKGLCVAKDLSTTNKQHF